MTSTHTKVAPQPESLLACLLELHFFPGFPPARLLQSVQIAPQKAGRKRRRTPMHAAFVAVPRHPPSRGPQAQPQSCPAACGISRGRSPQKSSPSGGPPGAPHSPRRRGPGCSGLGPTQAWLQRQTIHALRPPPGDLGVASLGCAGRAGRVRTVHAADRPPPSPSLAHHRPPRRAAPRSRQSPAPGPPRLLSC